MRVSVLFGMGIVVCACAAEDRGDSATAESANTTVETQESVHRKAEEALLGRRLAVVEPVSFAYDEDGTWEATASFDLLEPIAHDPNAEPLQSVYCTLVRSDALAGAVAVYLARGNVYLIRGLPRNERSGFALELTNADRARSPVDFSSSCRLRAGRGRANLEIVGEGL